jgi:hypothetical protein
MTLMSKKKLASLGHANYILRHYGYKATFIWGLCLYGIGSLVGEQWVQSRSNHPASTDNWQHGHASSIDLSAVSVRLFSSLVTALGPWKQLRIRTSPFAVRRSTLRFVSTSRRRSMGEYWTTDTIGIFLFEWSLTSS